MALSKQEERAIEKREGNPAGTYFAVRTLIVLLVLVGIYFAVVHTREASKSPVFQSNVSDPAHSASQ